jgi:hypothetical protein
MYRRRSESPPLLLKIAYEEALQRKEEALQRRRAAYAAKAAAAKAAAAGRSGSVGHSSAAARVNAAIMAAPIRHSLELVTADAAGAAGAAGAATAAKRPRAVLFVEEIDEVPRRRYKRASQGTMLYAATQATQQASQRASQMASQQGLYKSGVFADVEDIDSDSSSSSSDSSSSSSSGSEMVFVDPQYTAFAFESLKNYGPSKKFPKKKRLIRHSQKRTSSSRSSSK